MRAYGSPVATSTFFINGNTLADFDPSKVYLVGGSGVGLIVSRVVYDPSLFSFNMDWAGFIETNAITSPSGYAVGHWVALSYDSSTSTCYFVASCLFVNGN